MDTLIGRYGQSERNVISGNGRHGISVVGALWQNEILNNYIGTNANGDAALGNGGAGIRIADSYLTRVGTPEAGNVISGNRGRGIEIEQTSAGPGDTSSTRVQNNKIGTNPDGTAAIGNQSDGVALINTHDLDLGGSAVNERNVISGNGAAGVLITGPYAIYNSVQGNYIGTNATGDGRVGNAGAGVRVLDAYYNLIGYQIGRQSAANVISGNGGPGVEIVETVADGYAQANNVRGNMIGTSAGGTAGLGNREGVKIVDAAGNEVGGENPGERNIISGNGGAGVLINGSNAVVNDVQGNYIGTDIAGTSALGNGTGVLVSGASGNRIGGSTPGTRNVISGNGDGVEIRGESGASSNEVLGNYIGLTASGLPLGNVGNGILVADLAFRNLIGGTGPGEANVIAHNGANGVVVEDSGDITIRGNSIHSNGLKGIDLIGWGNGQIGSPVIDGIGTVDGFSRVSGTACGACTVEVYSDNEDEGRVYHRSVQADGFGNWTFVGDVTGPNVTATATDGGGNTSEFSFPLGCIDTDGDGTCDRALADNDRDGVSDQDEMACGADPRDPASRPERIDGPFAGVDDDGDGRVDEQLPFEQSYYHDCDGDGYSGQEESGIGTSEQDACGRDGWPSDLITGGLKPNSLSLEDLGSFIVPIRRLGTARGDSGFDDRWNLRPRFDEPESIDLEDMAALITGASGYPPMFGGQRAFGKTCPWAP